MLKIILYSFLLISITSCLGAELATKEHDAQSTAAVVSDLYIQSKKNKLTDQQEWEFIGEYHRLLEQAERGGESEEAIKNRHKRYEEIFVQLGYVPRKKWTPLQPMFRACAPEKVALFRDDPMQSHEEDEGAEG